MKKLLVLLSPTIFLFACQKSPSTGTQSPTQQTVSITSISPMSGSTNTVVTIIGTNFSPVINDNTVTFNGIAATVQSASATTLSVLAPAGGSTGIVKISTSANGTANGPVFTYDTVVTKGKVYIACDTTGNVSGNIWAMYWKDGVSQTLFTDIQSISPAQTTSIALSGTDVYVSGILISGSAKPVYWKNGTCSKLSPNSYGHANSIAISGLDVYVAGDIATDQSLSFIQATYWKNGIAVTLPFPSGYSSQNSYANSIVLSGSDVYVAGSINNASGPVAVIWKNAIPIVLSDKANANAVTISGNDVYVAGTSGTYNRIWSPTGSSIAQYWKNGIPTILGNGHVTCIGVAGSDIYVGGDTLIYINNIPFPVPIFWKNMNPTGMLTNYYNGQVSSIALSGSDVYVLANIGGKGFYSKNGVIVPIGTSFATNGFSQYYPRGIAIAQ